MAMMPLQLGGPVGLTYGLRPPQPQQQPQQQQQWEAPPSTANAAGIAEALASPIQVESGGWGEAIAEALAAGIRGRTARDARTREESLENQALKQEQGQRNAISEALSGFDPSNPNAMVQSLSQGAPGEALDLATALMGRNGRTPETRVTQSGTFWREGEGGAPQIMGRDPNWQPPASLQLPQPGMPVQGAGGYVWGPDGTQVAAPGGPADRRINTEQAQRARAALSRLDDQENVVAAINRAIELSGSGETGAIGSVMRGVPGTRAFDLDAQLDIIRANIGFDALMEMRANSPTGGALGAVTERELTLLQSTLEALNQAQSQEQFLAGLNRLKQTYIASMGRIRDAYAQDFGDAGAATPTPTNDGTAPEQPRERTWNRQTGRFE